MRNYNNIIFQFNKNPTLCNFLQLVAYDVWKRIEFARTRKGLKIFETTITQNILYELRIYSELYPSVPILMFESFDEARNGNDIELLVQTSEGFINFPIQSKIIYNNGKYPSMEHFNQINDLINYADLIGGIPLYLLYNYFSDNNFTYSGNSCGVIFSKEQYGCSLVGAHYLRDNHTSNSFKKNGILKWSIPTFMDLHPSVAIPWFLIGCCRNSSTDLVQTINILTNNSIVINDEIIQKIKKYNYEDLTNDNQWSPFNIKGINFENNKPFSNKIDKFSPKYRLVILTDETNSKVKK